MSWCEFGMTFDLGSARIFSTAIKGDIFSCHQVNGRDAHWPSGLVSLVSYHLITGCYLCVGSTPTSGNAWGPAPI